MGRQIDAVDPATLMGQQKGAMNLATLMYWLADRGLGSCYLVVRQIGSCYLVIRPITAVDPAT